MRKMIAKIKQIYNTQKIVERERKAHDEQIKKTSESICRAQKHLANGVTIKIGKALHGARR